MRPRLKFLLFPTAALLLAAATQPVTAQCSGASKTEQPAIEQPVQISQVEELSADSQSKQADTVDETIADSTAQTTTRNHAIPEKATELPTEVTSEKPPINTTIDATLDRAIQQVQKGTQGVKAGAKTVTKAVRALDELLKSFDEEPETVEPR